MLPSLAQTNKENGCCCPLPRLWASEQAGGLAAAAEGQEGSSSWAEVRYRDLSSAETAKCLVQLLPLCAGPHAGGRHCRASQCSHAGWARVVLPSTLTTGLLSLPHPSPYFFLLFLLLSLFSLGPSATSGFLTPSLSLMLFLPPSVCHSSSTSLSQSSGDKRDCGRVPKESQIKSSRNLPGL